MHLLKKAPNGAFFNDTVIHYNLERLATYQASSTKRFE